MITQEEKQRFIDIITKHNMTHEEFIYIDSLWGRVDFKQGIEIEREMKEIYFPKGVK